MGKLAKQLNAQKPWAWLRLSRAQYERIRPWKKSGLNREEYERIILCLPQDAIESLYEDARAEMLIKAIFKGVDEES